MINKQILVGNLGNQPETITFENGNSLTKFSVATSEKWIGKNSGEKKSHTEWHNIVTNGKVAETCAKYLTKGSKVYIEGKTRHRKYEQDGITKYITEVNAREVKFLDSKPQEGQSTSNTPNNANEPDDLPF